MYRSGKLQEVRSKNAPCVFDIPAIHGGRIPKALRGVSFVAGAWNPIHFVGCATIPTNHGGCMPASGILK
ncbi:hypothetical protein EZV61_00575 [Corallincola luteus]|uniref:Uncharacterized protein n=1 Tax=Corallincola luteus TaxID=1775177 RepID=A0ABY2ARJ6_9GAMM|nr:hypothetical protein [Corallincola luteus]TCI04507.1 hypothetical protein EZV61_00575 [Corallincola luteus]